MASRCRGNECDKSVEGWIWLDDMEMLETRVAGATFKMFDDVSSLWYLILVFFLKVAKVAPLFLKKRPPPPKKKKRRVTK